jgi:hypothetical protein
LEVRWTEEGHIKGWREVRIVEEKGRRKERWEKDEGREEEGK